jgi:hypothetical protein
VSSERSYCPIGTPYYSCVGGAGIPACSRLQSALPSPATQPAGGKNACPTKHYTDLVTAPQRRLVLLGLAALVLVAYLPALSQPLIEDDYPNIAQAKLYGEAGWSSMLSDSVFRVRATTWLLLYWTNRAFGMHAAAYYAATILLQILNTWLIFGLGGWKPLNYKMTAFAAAFFAVYEGHQEAIMWLSGSTEPLLLFFGLTAMLCWLAFLDTRKWTFYVVSLVSYCLALFSKESAVILCALLVLPLALDRKYLPRAVFLIPFTALSAASARLIFAVRSHSFRFQDGSFSLHAPFWLTWPSNFARLFWIWGLLSLAAILFWRPPNYRRILTIGLAWAGFGLIPYSFLTYSTRIPSRQIHLASVGLSLVVGLALFTLDERYWTSRRAVVIAICGVMLVQNVAYLWSKKRPQFLARAEPTEQLIALARTTRGPIYIQCFPRQRIIAEAALELMVPGRGASDLVWSEEEARAREVAATFCYKEP